MFQKFRTKHPKKIDPFDAEEMKLHELLARLDAGTDEYAKAQQQLKMVCTTREESRESRRRITKADRGGIIKKVLGGAVTLGGVLMLGRYEMDGFTFTGEKRTFADTFVRTLGRFFGAGD